MQTHTNPSRFSQSFLRAVLLLTPLTAGCLVTAQSEQRQSGNYVADSTFAQVKPGKTAGFVRATVGQPTKITSVEDGSEVWDYLYTERKESSGAVFLIFGGHDVKETGHHAFVELKNGIVTNAWRG
ncbi:MAG TPA: outer membrane protein assembly factor BamE [Tepidisphaeraceae bacterium]|jgi:outer membrane protein assembly factor BamE (lipoprotein component of BamABCDE complex)|nr:outer membrane protein assembly factor BamE [Tepidisphaeraceae bacterium]